MFTWLSYADHWTGWSKTNIMFMASIFHISENLAVFPNDFCTHVLSPSQCISQSSPFPILLCLTLFSFLTIISLSLSQTHTISLSFKHFIFLGPYLPPPPTPHSLSNPLQHLRTRHRKMKFRTTAPAVYSFTILYTKILQQSIRI